MMKKPMLPLLYSFGLIIAGFGIAFTLTQNFTDQTTGERNPIGLNSRELTQSNIELVDPALPQSSKNRFLQDSGKEPFQPSSDSVGLPINKTGMFWEPFGEDETIDDRIDKLLQSMTPEEIIGQVFLLGWDSEFAEGPIVDWIRTRNIGGIKIFGWNGRNIQTMTQTIGDLQTLALNTPHGIPLLTSTDQEGGWVRHVKDTTSITAGNMALGASRLPLDSYLAGYYIGKELRAMGINMNLAPTIDVYRNPHAYVIGPRAFSSDPDLTAVLGLAFFQGHEDLRVIATAKHFPGHGNATGDSHGELPVVYDTMEDLTAFDLAPFRLLIHEGVPAILTGHLSFPKVTGDYRPASLNRSFKVDILRGELGFEGIAVTDDLYMEGAWEYDRTWTISDITLEALRAGNDLVMLSRTPALNDRIWTRIVQEYQLDSSFRDQIHESVRRILNIKYQYLFNDDRVPLRPNPQTIYNYVPAPGSREFFAEQAARSVHVLADVSLPITEWNPSRTLLMGQDPDFFSVGRRYFPGAREFRFPYTPIFFAPRWVLDEAPRVGAGFDTIIFNLTNTNSSQVLATLEPLVAQGINLIVFSILTPAYLRDMEWIQNAIAVYGWGTDSFEAGFSVIKGFIPGVGQNPIPSILVNR
jgi:beta-N-acetylhexosaminidase